MGTSTLTFLLTLAGSMSTWTILAFMANSVELAGDAIVEASADGDDEVGLGHRHVGGVGAVHAQHAERLRIARREAAEAHQGGRHRHVELLGQLQQLVGCALDVDHAAADVEHGLFGLAP